MQLTYSYAYSAPPLPAVLDLSAATCKAASCCTKSSSCTGAPHTPPALVVPPQVLSVEASNIEATACLAAYHFYADQPELALRYFRRLLQTGLATAELWNNLALACLYAGQFDLVRTSFERGLRVADDTAAADIWWVECPAGLAG